MYSYVAALLGAAALGRLVGQSVPQPPVNCSLVLTRTELGELADQIRLRYGEHFDQMYRENETAFLEMHEKGREEWHRLQSVARIRERQAVQSVRQFLNMLR